MTESGDIIGSALFISTPVDKGANYYYNAKSTGSRTIPQAIEVLNRVAGTAAHSAFNNLARLQSAGPKLYEETVKEIDSASQALWGSSHPNDFDLQKPIPLTLIDTAGSIGVIEGLASSYQNPPNVVMHEEKDQAEAEKAAALRWDRIKKLHSVVTLALYHYDNRHNDTKTEVVMREVDMRGGSTQYYDRLTAYVRNPQKRQRLASALGVSELALGKNLFLSLVANVTSLDTSRILNDKRDEELSLREKAEMISGLNLAEMFATKTKADIKSILVDENQTDIQISEKELESLLAHRLVEKASREIDLFFGGKYFREEYKELHKNLAFNQLIAMGKIDRVQQVLAATDLTKQKLKEQILELISDNDRANPENDNMPYINPEILERDAARISLTVLRNWQHGIKSFYSRFSLQSDRVGVYKEGDVSPIQEESLAALRNYAKKYYDKEVSHPLQDFEYWKLLENAAKAGCTIELREDKFPQGEAPDELDPRYSREIGVNMIHLLNLLASYERQKGNDVNVFNIIDHPIIQQLHVKVLYCGYKIENESITPDIKEFQITAREIFFKSEDYLTEYRNEHNLLEAQRDSILRQLTIQNSHDLLEKLNDITNQINEHKEILRRNTQVRKGLIAAARTHINKSYAKWLHHRIYSQKLSKN